MEHNNSLNDGISTEELRAAIQKLEASNSGQELYAKKQYRLSQLSAFCSVVMLCAVLFTCAILIPRMNTLFNNMESVMTNIDTVADGLANADLPSVVSNIDRLVVTSEGRIMEALEQINAIDIETLNKSIKDLSDIINPIARLFGKGK